MESESKRLRKKGIQRSTSFISGQGQRTNGFSNSTPPFSPFPTEITRQFPQYAHAGPWTFQPGFACKKILARNCVSELDEKC
jgi:hypothetical protein